MEDEPKSIAAAVELSRAKLLEQSRVGAISHKRWASSRLIDLNLWASRLGISAKDQNALEERLSHFPDVGDAMMVALRALIITLARASQIPLDAANPKPADYVESKHGSQRLTDTPHLDRSSVRPSMLGDKDLSSDGHSDMTTNDSDDDENFEQSLCDAEEIISQLIELGSLLKRAGKSSRLRKADASYKRSHHAEFEAFLRIYLYRGVPLDTPHSASQYIHHSLLQRASEHHGKELNDITTDDLTTTARERILSPEQDHLISTNLRRRNRLNFAFKRAVALSGNAGFEIIEDDKENSLPQFIREQPRQAAEILRLDENATAMVQSLADVSTLDGKILRDIPRQSLQQVDAQPNATPSVEMTSTTARVRHPKPPRSAEGMLTFCCPACAQSLPISTAQPARWKAHLAQDLAPYTCPYPYCISSDPMFISASTWRAHINESHRVATHFQCLFCTDSKPSRPEHDSRSHVTRRKHAHPVSAKQEITFRAEYEYADHVAESHAGSVSAKQAITFGSEYEYRIHVAENHAGSVSAEFETTLRDLSIKLSVVPPPGCPVCGETSQGKELESFLDHLCKCMHDFSLLALPWATAVEDRTMTEERREEVSAWLDRLDLQDGQRHDGATGYIRFPVTPSDSGSDLQLDECLHPLFPGGYFELCSNDSEDTNLSDVTQRSLEPSDNDEDTESSIPEEMEWSRERNDYREEVIDRDISPVDAPRGRTNTKRKRSAPETGSGQRHDKSPVEPLMDRTTEALPMHSLRPRFWRIQNIKVDERDVAEEWLLAQTKELAIAEGQGFSLAADSERTLCATLTSYERPEPSNRHWRVDRDFIGFTPLCDPEDANVDVVAVTGLGGHALESFRSSDGKSVWLRDFAPQDVPRARFITYGYNTGVVASDSNQGVHELALTFLEGLAIFRQRTQTQQRPLVFVCHSLGGVVLKQALVMSGEATDVKHKKLLEVMTVTYGLVFMGVPNLGLKHNQLETVVKGRPNEWFVRDLLVRSDGEAPQFLSHLTREFSDLDRRRDSPFEIVSYYETVSSPTVVDSGDGHFSTDGPRELMVTKMSAERIGHLVRNIEHLSSDTDHRGLVRFEHSLDRRYVSMVEKLKDMAAAAPQVLSRTVNNQRGQLTIYGDRHIHIPRPAAAARPNRYISMPFATISTYTERPQLTEELEVNLGKRHRGAGLAHAVAVTGLGGTGKTQLVLHYTERHEEEYDTILWIDVSSEETARSSYERCCRTLSLPVEVPLSDGALRDIPAVQAVLSWLRSRDEDKRWLAVMDNVNDLSWDASSVVPRGKAGTLIVTSQDAQVSRLLGGRMPTVRVDAMEPEEAVRLLSNYFDEPLLLEDGCLALVRKIVDCLDRLAFALDLAGARIQADVENGNDLATALRQYITDYRRSQDRLLRDDEFARVSFYKKTVWTAWESSLASLKGLEDSQGYIYPIKLLSFVTLLDQANVQEELFRLASLGLEDACDRLNVKAPTWMQRLLSKRGDGEWDDFSYRASVKLLLRHGLVRPVGGIWKGTTMHSLVQWWVGAGIDRGEYWRLYLAFMAAVCVSIGEVAEDVQFRRHVLVHLPPNRRLINDTSGIEEQGLWWMWSQVGHVLWQEGRWQEAEELQVKVLEARRRVLGEEHPDTINAIGNLAATYRNQGQKKEGEELEVKVLDARTILLGEEQPDTITAMANLAHAKFTPHIRSRLQDTMTSSRPIRVLSLDGGGVRGLAELVVLEKLFQRLNYSRKQAELPTQEPWELFDIMGGTSTGGLIAVMLGRLKMSISECLEHYQTLSEQAFSKKNLLKRTRRGELSPLGAHYDTAKLEEAIKSVINDSDSPQLLREDDEDPSCKVFVMARLENLSRSACFRSYYNNEKSNELYETITVWEACRATSAATTFFDPIMINGSRYSDSGLQYNNPISIAYAEALEMFPGRQLQIVSLGTGTARLREYDPGLATVAKQLADIATATHNQTQEFLRNWDDAKGEYFRFSPDFAGQIGLEEARQLDEIRRLTVEWIDETETGRNFVACAKAISGATGKSLEVDRQNAAAKRVKNLESNVQSSTSSSQGALPGR